MNVAVFGDLSGHLEPLLGALDELGVDLATACVPDGHHQALGPRR
jgi:hypothetical protein